MTTPDEPLGWNDPVNLPEDPEAVLRALLAAPRYGQPELDVGEEPTDPESERD